MYTVTTERRPSIFSIIHNKYLFIHGNEKSSRDSLLDQCLRKRSSLKAIWTSMNILIAVPYSRHAYSSTHFAVHLVRFHLTRCTWQSELKALGSVYHHSIQFQVMYCSGWPKGKHLAAKSLPIQREINLVYYIFLINYLRGSVVKAKLKEIK